MLMTKTDVQIIDSDDDMDQPKPKRTPVAKKNSQRQENLADQRDLTTKGSSTQKSNRIRKFLFFFFALWLLSIIRSQH
jgi:hypothetical protein